MPSSQISMVSFYPTRSRVEIILPCCSPVTNAEEDKKSSRLTAATAYSQLQPHLLHLSTTMKNCQQQDWQPASPADVSILAPVVPTIVVARMLSDKPSQMAVLTATTRSSYPQKAFPSHIFCPRLFVPFIDCWEAASQMKNGSVWMYRVQSGLVSLLQAQ